jgi:4-nitrophenyl phosphatase
MGSSSNYLEQLRNVRAVLLDMDGVVYRGRVALPGVQELLDYLESTVRSWLFVTNNATKTPELFSKTVQAMGIQATADHILGSAQATASWLAEVAPQGGRVQVVGQVGLISALLSAGFELATDPFEAEFVVAAADFDLTYKKLADATLAIRHGARFIGTNNDATWPGELGLLPGAGSILALLETATGVKPEIIGKPFPGMFQQAMHSLKVEPSQTMMVGDRYDTDIAGAIDLGLVTVGVLTGVSTREMFEQVDAPPALVVTDLPELLALFREADG